MDDLIYKKERPWIKWLVSTLIGLVIAVGYMGVNDVFSGTLIKADVARCVSDGFFIAGVLLTGIGILVFCARNGTFDMLAYGVKIAIRTIFKAGGAESFYDYKQRLGQTVTPCAFLIVPGVIMLFISAVGVGAFYQL